MIRCYGTNYNVTCGQDSFYSNLLIVDKSESIKEEEMSKIAFYLKSESFDTLREVLGDKYSLKFFREAGYTKVRVVKKSLIKQFISNLKEILEYVFSQIDKENGALD